MIVVSSYCPLNTAGDSLFLLVIITVYSIMNIHIGIWLLCVYSSIIFYPLLCVFFSLNEVVMHFGKSIGEIVKEDFGDGMQVNLQILCFH